MSAFPRQDSLQLLHSKAIIAFNRLNEALIVGHETGATKTLFKPFETLRSPDRQLHLFAIGASKARPWQSAHQYGLAVDFVPFVKKAASSTYEFSWREGEDYTFLNVTAKKCGLEVPISWDLCHVEHPLFQALSFLK